MSHARAAAGKSTSIVAGEKSPDRRSRTDIPFKREALGPMFPG
jgi:hypothetical protein